jgi:hypothetical protein
VSSKQKAVGSGQCKIAANGDLVVHLDGDDEIRFHKPIVYQEQESGVRSQKSEAKNETQSSSHRQSAIGNRQSIDGRFVLDAQNRVHFALGPYDHTRPLVIDPVLVYSTYLGGSNADKGYGVAVDSSGNAYVVGATNSGNFPLVNPFLASMPNQAGCGGCFKAFVAKLAWDSSTSTASMVYSTYLGGSADDFGYAIAVDSSGNAYVTGDTQSSDFPTLNPINQTVLENGTSTAYSGSSLASTVSGIPNAFVAELDGSGSALVYSTYLGGAGGGNSSGGGFFGDHGYGIALDSSGNAYVTGFTGSTNFPTVNPINQLVYQNGAQTMYTGSSLGGPSGSTWNVFVAKLNWAASTSALSLVYSTYLGATGGDAGLGIAVDSSENAYVTGYTQDASFPVTAGAIKGTFTGGQDAFVAKLNWNPSASPPLSLVYSTYLGGIGCSNNFDQGHGIAVDFSGNAYVAGLTACSTFPTANPINQTVMENAVSTLYSGSSLGATGAINAFVTELGWNGSALSLVYSTYLGGNSVDEAFGIALDSSANAYVTGYTQSSNFPTLNALQSSLSGYQNPFVAELNWNGSALSLVYSTYLGGPDREFPITSGDPCDYGQGIAVDSSGNAFFTGCTPSTSFPTINPIYQAALENGTSTTYSGSGLATNNYNAFVAEIGAANAPGIAFGPESLTFASQLVGTTSAPQSVTLTAAGSQPLKVASITITGDFALAGATSCPSGGGTVPAGTTCTISVTFKPTAPGLRTGSVFVSENAAVSPQSIPLSGTGILVVPTTTSISAPAITYGTAASVAVSVTSGQGAVTGSVSLSVDSGAPLTQTLSSGSAVFTISGLAAGTHSLSASYAAQGNYAGSTATGSLTVNQAPLTITASSGSMIYGGPVFPVSPSYTGFVNGDTSAKLTTQPTCSTLATSSSPVGTYASSCSGAVDSNYTINYVAGNVTVLQATTTTALTSSVNPSTYMQLVTFTATVTPQYSGTPTGSVTFYNNGSPIRTGTLSVTSCGTPPCPDQATFSTSSLPTGSDSITAAYGGDGNFTGSASSAIIQTVQPAPIVSLSPLSVSFGNQNVNTTSSGSKITLSNAGDATLNISTNGISIAQPSTDFAQANTCGSTLGVGASCTITVTFTPVATGIRTASLQITDNDDDTTGAQQIVSLTGAGLSTIAGGSLYTDTLFATANACSSITMSGGSTVDSFNSTQGYSSSHALSGGNVGTNGNVNLSGGSVIYGSAAVDSLTTGNCSKTALTGLTTSGGAQVTGGLVALNGPITYPAPPAPNPAPPTTNQNISGSCGSISGCTNQSGNRTVTLAPGQYGNLNMSGGTTAHFGKGTYNVNSLTLSGGSILYVDSGPVIVNLAGASLSGGNPAMNTSGGSIQNPSGIPANLQFTYAGSQGVNLSGGSGSYTTVYAPNALVNMSGGSHFFGSIIASTITDSGGTAIHYDTSLPSIRAGNYIWFNAVVNNVNNLGSGQVKLYLTDSTISFTANGTPYTVPVPNAVVTFNSASQTSGAKTTYDQTNSRWSTAVAASGLTGNTFVAGVAFQVPSGGFPSGIQNVMWSASFSTDIPGVTLHWQWGAAVYTSLSTTYATGSNANVLGVNAEDGSADQNGTDPAGTPENYKQYLIFGATGGGLTSYTGYFSPAAGVVPTIAPMSVSPSSVDFVPQKQGTTSAAMTAVLTNNDSTSHNISSITITGTNASNFAFAATNTCPVSASTLAAGASCTIAVTFTPSDVGTRTARIVISDDANNSPQTVYLSGTGQ